MVKARLQRVLLALTVAVVCASLFSGVQFVHAANSCTYSPSANTITVVGYSSGSTPWGFNDLWVYDKAGTLTLDTRTGISAVDGAPDAFSYNLRPTDYYVLGGAANDLYITVSSWSGLTNCTIEIFGTDSAGGSQAENFTFTGAATQYSALLYHTLTQSQVVVFSGSGSFTYAVSEGQWGVVWKQSSTQYAFDCKLQVGDGSTATYFTDINKQILVSVSGGYIYTKVGSTFTLGSIDANGNTYNGCTLTFTNPNIQAWSSDGSTGDIYLYASMVKGYMFWRMYRGSSQIVKIIDCTIDGWIGGRFQGASGVIKRLRIHDGTLYGLTLVSPNPVVSEVRVDRSDYAVFINADVSSIVSMNLVTARNNVKSIYVYPASVAASLALIDCDFDAWTLNFASAGTVFRQYEFDLTVSNENGNALSGRNVTLTMKNGTQVLNQATNSTGQITTQTLTYGYYDQAHGNTLQSSAYSPYNLTIYDYTGTYLNYTTTFTPLAKTAQGIALQPYMQAAFTWAPLLRYANETVFFDASNSSSSAPISTFKWDFGDGLIGFGERASHVYTQSGNYTATVMVTSVDGEASFSSVVVVADVAKASAWYLNLVYLAVIIGVLAACVLAAYEVYKYS